MQQAQQDPSASWLPLSEAAARLGLSVDTLRRRLKRGELARRQVATRQGFTWEVCLEALPTSAVAAQVGSNDAQALLEEKDRRIEDMATAIEVYQATIASLQQRREDYAKAEAELRQLLGREQAAHAETRVLLQALLPKLEQPREEEHRPWWKWWWCGRFTLIH